MIGMLIVMRENKRMPQLIIMAVSVHRWRLTATCCFGRYLNNEVRANEAFWGREWQGEGPKWSRYFPSIIHSRRIIIKSEAFWMNNWLCWQLYVKTCSLAPDGQESLGNVMWQGYRGTCHLLWGGGELLALKNIRFNDPSGAKWFSTTNIAYKFYCLSKV